jgi:glycosyltransferase involved in cell wall biosynthesis
MQAADRVSVTIGIPTYSRLQYLKESAASALAQGYPNLEILISQNPHPSPAIREEIEDYCRELVAKDSRVRYQLLPRDQGPPANFNAIAKSARGEYLMMIGDDDKFIPDAVERLASAVGPETVLVFGKRHIIDSEGKRLKLEPNIQPGWFEPQCRVPLGRLIDPELWAWQQAMGTETSLIRTRDFQRILFRESIDMPDLEFFILLARERGEFISIPHFVTEYRLHADSTTARQFVNYDDLIDLLVPLRVSEDVEPHKARIIHVLILHAITRSLSMGDFRHARRLLQNKYFHPESPRWRSGAMTRLWAVLPRPLAAPAYNAYRLWRASGLGIGGERKRSEPDGL